MHLDRKQFLPLVFIALCTLESDARELVVGPGGFDTIQAAVDIARPGDDVVILPGVYRESVVVRNSGTPKAPIRITGRGRVVLTGADRLTDWRPTDTPGVYAHEWTHVLLPENTPRYSHPNDERHELIGRCEQVFVHGRPLRQVLEREQLAPGTFFVDLDAKTLYACSVDRADLSHHEALVEASVRAVPLRVAGNHIEAHQLTVRYAANRAQQGAVGLFGKNIQLRFCTIEQTNGVGVACENEGQFLWTCSILNHGQLGFAADGAHGLQVGNCDVTGNNTKGFDVLWEAGGCKIVLSRDVEIFMSRFERNHGPGIWFDIGNEDAEVAACFLRDNGEAGLFFEISKGLTVDACVIDGNGFAHTPGSWGAAAGVAISSSENVTLTNNTIFDNREGIALREQTRTTPTIGKPLDQQRPIRNRNIVIDDNTVENNAEGQLVGWFDMDDEAHWPRAMQEQPDRARSLKDLGLVLDDNRWEPAAGQPLAIWGADWRRHIELDSVEKLREFVTSDSE